MEDLCLLSATRIAQLIRDGAISSRQAVDAHIEQIQQVNPWINAVVAERFDAARREADAADARAGEATSGPHPIFKGTTLSHQNQLLNESFSL